MEIFSESAAQQLHWMFSSSNIWGKKKALSIHFLCLRHYLINLLTSYLETIVTKVCSNQGSSWTLSLTKKSVVSYYPWGLVTKTGIPCTASPEWATWVTLLQDVLVSHFTHNEIKDLFPRICMHAYKLHWRWVPQPQQRNHAGWRLNFWFTPNCTLPYSNFQIKHTTVDWLERIYDWSLHSKKDTF